MLAGGFSVCINLPELGGEFPNIYDHCAFVRRDPQPIVTIGDQIVSDAPHFTGGIRNKVELIRKTRTHGDKNQSLSVRCPAHLTDIDIAFVG